ncbi:MAG TPA: ribose 5-phosphate isomerase B [Bacteroidia bacterium]|nr:ribose 5-phosphate isomerase B [Bacteroidia bacterium]
MEKRRIAIGSDHAGFALKEKIKSHLSQQNFEITDVGTYSEERADYSDYGHLVANAILEKKVFAGILICGSGNGINMTANKHAGIRAALCWKEEIALLARQHNDANILSLPARFISDDEAFKCVAIFFKTDFEGGRHCGRVEKIDIKK